MSRLTRIVRYLKLLASGNSAPSDGRYRSPVDIAVEAAMEDDRLRREAFAADLKRKADIWLQRPRWKMPSDVYSGPLMTPQSFREVDNLPDANDPDRMTYVEGSQFRAKLRMKGLYWENGILHALYEDTREEYNLDKALACRINLETNQLEWWDVYNGSIKTQDGQVFGDHDLDCLARSPLFKFEWSSSDGRWERHAPIMRLMVQWKGQILYSRDICLHVPGLGGLYRVDESDGRLHRVAERSLSEMHNEPERTPSRLVDEDGNDFSLDLLQEDNLENTDDVPAGFKVGYICRGIRYATGRAGFVNEGPNTIKAC